MRVGIEVSKDLLNARAGDVVVQLRDALARVGRVAEFLGRTTDEDLGRLGLTEDEAYLLRVAFERLDTVRLVAYGQAAVTDPVDHFEHASKLTGLE
jgi:hypothetical protein